MLVKACMLQEWQKQTNKQKPHRCLVNHSLKSDKKTAPLYWTLERPNR